MLKQADVYIGFDPSESVAASVLQHSIRARSSIPVRVTLLMLDQLREIHKRERHHLQSTEFSFTRFLTPYLNRYSSHSIYMDCDMLMLGDIADLYKEAEQTYAPVSVVKHDYKPENTVKMLGQKQTQYEKKNWSSLMVFWGKHYDCMHLTPEVVDEESGLHLHQFAWATDVGEIDGRWNHLVGYDERPLEDIAMLHWTEGGPWWERYKNAEYADIWFEEKERMEQSYERPKAVTA